MNERVRVTVDRGVAQVVLSRPEKRNALDAEMFAGLVAAGERLAEDVSVRAVVLSGEGPDFCAGLDLAAFRAIAERGGRADPEMGRRGQRAVTVWAELPAPVVVAVRGNALGGGLQLTLGADIRIVAPDARLSVLEVKWGLVPDMTGTQLLPELVGRDVAKELTYTGRVLSGEEAAAIGLATRVAEDPLAEACTLAGEIAGRSPHSVRAAKRLLDLAGRVDLETGLAAERAEMAALVGSPNQVEAITASFENRPPVFED